MSRETQGDGWLTLHGEATAISGGVLPHDARVAIVCSRYHSNVMQVLLDGAIAVANEQGVPCDVIYAEGAFELGLLSLETAKTGRYVGVAALGCVIRGETSHYDFVCSETARGILSAGLGTGIPVAFGLITCETAEQAFERAGGEAGNKGAEAVSTALETARTLAAVRR